MDWGRVRAELVDQGRGVTGALLVVGTSMLFTMEVTWLGGRLPPEVLLTYTVVGLALVLVVTKYVGFRQSEQGETDRSTYDYVTDFSELLMQSFVTAYAVLLLFGFLRLDDPVLGAVRLGLIFVVPLAFGASIANRLLGKKDGGGDGGGGGGGSDSGGGSDGGSGGGDGGSGGGDGGSGAGGGGGGGGSDGQGNGGNGGGGETGTRGRSFVHDLVVYAAGAVFVATPFAPTQEVPLVATTAGWPRLFAMVVGTVLVAYLILFELEFRGHDRRVGRKSPLQQWGTAFTLYTISVAVCALLLAGFGQFLTDQLAVVVQQVIALSFPGAIGASAGTVVLS
jgi:uncharacterized membrane protein